MKIFRNSILNCLSREKEKRWKKSEEKLMLRRILETNNSRKKSIERDTKKKSRLSKKLKWFTDLNLEWNKKEP